MRNNKNEIVVLRECECKAERKVKHHPDYSKPLEVELLCQKCHSRAHSQQTIIYFPTETDRIALGMLQRMNDVFKPKVLERIIPASRKTIVAWLSEESPIRPRSGKAIQMVYEKWSSCLGEKEE